MNANLHFTRVRYFILTILFASISIVVNANIGVTTSASGGTNISADKAANATSPGFTTLGNIVLTEGATDDFQKNSGTKTFLINAPSGWNFNTGASLSVSAQSGRDINSISIVATSTTVITVTVTVPSGNGGADAIDIITISGVQVRSTEGGNLPASVNLTLANGTGSPVGLNGLTCGALSQAIGTTKYLVITLPGQTFTDATTLAASGNTGSVTAQTAGTGFVITKIRSCDQFYNVDATYSGSKTISYSGPGGAPTYTTSVSFTSGASTTTLNTTLLKAETATIAATDGTLSGKVSSNLTVNTGAVNKLQILMPGETAAPATVSGKTGSSSVQNAGTAFNVTVNGVDANWNVVSSANNTVTITSSDLYAILPSPAALVSGTKIFSVKLIGQSSQTVTASATGLTSAMSSVTVNPNTVTTWTGNSNNDWSNPGNWTNGLPGISTFITVADITPYPMLSNNYTVNDLAISGNAILGINGKILTINGAVTGTGTLSGSSSSNLVIAGNAGTLKFTTGSAVLKDLTLNTGASATLGTGLDITAGVTPGVLTVNTGATLTTGGNLTLKSDVDGTSRVGLTNGTISGDVSVERYIPQSRTWRLLTAPVASTSQSIRSSWQNGGVYEVGKGTFVTGTSANPGSNGLDVSPQNKYSMYKYNTSSQALTPVTNSNSNHISTNAAANNDNVAYFIFVRGDRDPANLTNPNASLISNTTTLKAKGALQTGSQVLSVASNPASGKLSMLGNPFASPIDFETVTRTTNVQNRFWIWTTQIGDVGGYVTGDWNGSSYDYSPIVSGVDKIFQSGEAFFIECTATGTASTESITVKETDKVASSNQLGMFRPQSGNTMESFRTDLYYVNTNNTVRLADGVLAQYQAGFNANVTTEDAIKFPNNKETMSLVRDSKLLAIEKRPLIQEKDTLFYNLASTSQKDYRFVFTATGLDHPGLKAVLEDYYLATQTPLNLNSTTEYNFTINSVTASQSATRFRVIFAKDESPVPVHFTNLEAFEISGKVKIEWKVEGENGIEYYEVERSVNGKDFIKIGSVDATNNNGAAVIYSLTDQNALSGDNFYRIKSVGIAGDTKYTGIAKVSIDSKSSGFSIYPNPVKEGHISIQIKNQPEGKYGIKITNASGQLLLSTTSDHNGGNKTEVINLPSIISKGIYTLEITKPGIKTFTQRLVILN